MSKRTITPAPPTLRASAAPVTLPEVHRATDGANLEGGHATDEAHSVVAPPNLDPDHVSVASHHPHVGASINEEYLARSEMALAMIQIASMELDDIEAVREAMGHRLYQLRSREEKHGIMVSPEHAAFLEEQIKYYQKGPEHEAELRLVRALRKHPLAPWIKAQKGLGLKQAGRLIGAMGDPYYWVDGDGSLRIRTGPAQLWAYTGNAPSQKRERGTRSGWNHKAKSRAYLCAKSAMKSGIRKLDGCDDSNGYDIAHRQAISEYGALYLKAREKYQDSTHDAPCPCCGPKGSPAPVGSPLSEGHKHARALRILSKEILRGLWEESKNLGGAIDVSISNPRAPRPQSFGGQQCFVARNADAPETLTA